MLTKRLAFVCISAVIFVVAAWFYLRPAWMSEASIRKSLLKQTPLGSSMGEVRTLAEKKGWIEPGVHVDSYVAFSTGTGTDVSAFSGRLGHDPFPYRTTLAATWEFDHSNRLVNISVLRHE